MDGATKIYRATRMSVEILQLQKIPLENYRVPGQSSGIICVILRLGIFIQYRSVTDTHTERQMDGQIHDDGMYRA